MRIKNLILLMVFGCYVLLGACTTTSLKAKKLSSKTTEFSEADDDYSICDEKALDDSDYKNLSNGRRTYKIGL